MIYSSVRHDKGWAGFEDEKKMNRKKKNKKSLSRKRTFCCIAVCCLMEQLFDVEGVECDGGGTFPHSTF